jgi:hypothetical protein
MTKIDEYSMNDAQRKVDKAQAKKHKKGMDDLDNKAKDKAKE